MQEDFDLKSEAPHIDDEMDQPLPIVKLGNLTDLDSRSSNKDQSQEMQFKIRISDEYHGMGVNSIIFRTPESTYPRTNGR